MRALRRIWRREGADRLTPTERWVLDCMLAALSPSASALLRTQLAAVNLVQRHLRGREVNLYRIRRGRATADLRLAVPNRAREARLGGVSFVPAYQENPIEASLYLVDGFLFSIVFDAPPPRIPPTTARRVVIETDPMATTGSAPPFDRAALPADFGAEAASRAASGTDVALLPADEVYRADLDDGPFLVLAMVGGRGVLAVPADGSGAEVIFIGYEQGEPRRAYPTLAAAVEAAASPGRH